MNKKLFTVKFKFFTYEFEHSFKKPNCLPQEYCEFLFNWSIETAKQMAYHLLASEPIKFFISSVTEVEMITNKKEIFQKIIDKSENKKIDKFELIALIPFIVESNFEIALNTTLNFFCLENEDESIITKNEFGLFIDSFFRSLHNIVKLDDIDEIYERTQNHIVRLADSEIEEILNNIFTNNAEEMKVEDVVK